MFDGEHNIESTKPASKAAEPLDVDRLPATKSLAHQSEASRTGTTTDFSLENPNTSGLYSSTQSSSRDKSQNRGASSGGGAGDVWLIPPPLPEASADVAEISKAKSIETPTGRVFPESAHKVQHGETIEGISRKLLGPKASQQEVINYAIVAGQLNGISDPKQLRADDRLQMPGRDSMGAITFINPENADEHCAVNRDGKYEIHNVWTKTSSLQTSLDGYGSFKAEHKGSSQYDNYDETFIHKDHYTLITRKGADGKTIAIGSDGFKKVTDKDGNWVSDSPPNLDPYHATYDKSSGVTTQKNSDGSVNLLFDKDNHSEAIEPDGTKTSRYEDGSVKIERKDSQGRESGSYNHPDGKGGYTEHGWGPSPKDNYEEKYSARSGVTTRTEGKGTPQESTTTRSPDGTVNVLSKDGKNYRRNPDGSEHHWGSENFDKPAYQYENNVPLNESRESLRDAVHGHVPANRQAAFRNDMADFETRARKDHLPPEEISRTYVQISELLNATNKTALVSSTDRALLAEGLIHQSADVQDTNQGNHNTCNATSVLKLTLKRHPSVAAEMAATIAITGAWTSADGHTVHIDKASLQPQAEESTYPPHPGDRSYATQVLNLVMVNDALQRRPVPLTYVQRTPEGPDDTGERRLDANQNVIQANQYDAKTDTWKVSPDASPGLSDREVIESARRLNGDAHLIACADPQAGVESVANEQGLADKLQQFKNQGKLPVILGVDAHHVPVQDLGNESPSYGAHFVDVGSYDQHSGRVHIENQWGKQSNRWVNIRDLYNNASGNMATSQDGVTTSDYQ